MANSAFTPSVLTIAGSSAATSGEKNYILSPDDNAASRWVSSGAGVTVSTSTSTLPDNITKTTSIAIARSSGTTVYAYYRFTLDQADYSKKFKISWDQVYSGTAGDFQLQVYSNTASNYSGTSTALTVQTAAIPAITGSFVTTVDMPGSVAPYIELRIVATAGSTLYLSSVLVGPGTIVQGAAISEWQSYTPSNLQDFGSITNPTFEWRRVGSSMQVRGSLTTGTIGSLGLQFGLPTGYTITALAGGNSLRACGKWIQSSSSSTAYKTGTVYATSGLTYVTFGADGGYSNTDNSYASRAGNFFPLASSANFTLQFEVAVAEWSGSGTVNLGPGAQVEYAASTTGTWDAAAAAANTVYGPTGAPISGSLGANRAKVVRFQYPIQATDELVLEFQINGTEDKWVPAAQTYANLFYAPTVQFGAYISDFSGGTDVTVTFFQYAAPGTGYNVTTGAQNWSSGSFVAWRLKKVNPSSPVGFGLVNSTSAGLLPATATIGLIRYNTSNGYGSTNTRVRRFSTQEKNTSDITHPADTSASGSSFTINTAGIYSITYSDSFSAAATFGISVNSADLTNSIANITAATRLIAASSPAANYIDTVNYTGYFASGDVIRPHADGTTSGSSAAVLSTFTIQRIA